MTPLLDVSWEHWPLRTAVRAASPRHRAIVLDFDGGETLRLPPTMPEEMELLRRTVKGARADDN